MWLIFYAEVNVVCILQKILRQYCCVRNSCDTQAEEGWGGRNPGKNDIQNSGLEIHDVILLMNGNQYFGIGEYCVCSGGGGDMHRLIIRKLPRM